MRRKWRPSLWFVLGGALAGTLILSLAGLLALRLLGPEIGFRYAAVLLALVIGALTALLWWLFLRLLLRPVTALSRYAAQVQAAPGAVADPPAHFGTREIQAMAQSVIDMGATLANREVTIRSFTNHVSHELKTPLSAMQAAAELLGDSETINPADRKLVDSIHGATAQMERQLAALRNVAAAREANYHGVSHLGDLIATLRPNFPDLTITQSGPDLALPLSAQGLILILGHLLSNAANHGATQFTLGAGQGPNGTHLTIADNGHGVSNGNRAHLFTAFFTTRRDTGGTGMGLFIVASILNAHGANIALQESDIGATFLIAFPDT